MTQNNLGAAYQSLPTGDRGENLQQAIECYTAALRVYTEVEFPQQWAETTANIAFVEWDAAKEWQQAEEKLVRAIEVFERIGHQHHAEKHQRWLAQLRQERENQSGA